MQTSPTSLFTTPSLRRRLIVMLLLVGLLPQVLMGILGTWQATNTLEHQIGARLDDLATTTIEKVDRILFDRVNDVQTFASTSEARTLDPQVLTPLMNQLVRAYSPIYIVMIATDMQGRVRAVNTADIYANVPNLVGNSVADEEWFRVWTEHPLPSGQSYISDMHVEPLLKGGDMDSGRVIVLSYPIRDTRGAIIGVWSAFLDWEVIRALTNDALASAHANGAASMALTLINKDGVVLISPDHSAVLRDHVALSAAQRQAIQRRTLADTDGRDWFDPHLLTGVAASLGYSNYHGLGWTLIATEHRDEALQPVQKLWSGVLLIGLIVAGCVVALGALAGRLVTQPIIALTAVAARAAEGDLAQRAPTGSNDEVGRLGNAFNHMISQVAEAQRTLEARVEERTASLQHTLQTLEQTLHERDSLSMLLRQSSVPIIPLVDQIAVMPIIGALDSDRIRQIQESLLHGIERDNLRTVLLDITGVPIVDTLVARGIIMATQAARLLGCQVSLVGIRPEVAQTMVQLGVTFHDLPTHATLQAGLHSLLQQALQRETTRARASWPTN